MYAHLADRPALLGSPISKGAWPTRWRSVQLKTLEVYREVTQLCIEIQVDLWNTSEEGRL